MTARSLAGLCGLLGDRADAIPLDARDTEPAGVLDLLEQDARAHGIAPEDLDVRAQIVLVDLIPEDHHERPSAHQIARLCERIGNARLALLVGIGDAHAQIGAVPEQRPDLVAVAADDHHQIGHARLGQRADGEVDHRLVEEVEDMLVHDRRHRPEARPETARQHHSLHRSSSR